jgi:exosortase A-associated hydrolase 1
MTASAIAESAITINTENYQLLAILHSSKSDSKVGVLVVVGGPQYRVGSHRQFVQLSRALAKQGIPSMRFDYTGMGDSGGEKKSFEHICDDIAAACDVMCQQLNINEIVIWGLCDAASAAMIYAHKDARVSGLVILNPWLRSDAAMGKTMLKYYYLQRLLSKNFWKKLLKGKINVASSVGDAKGFVKDSMTSQDNEEHSYQSRMQAGLSAFNGKICLILSGVDLTAKEFEQQSLDNKNWQVLKSERTHIHRLEQADHTFSSSSFKREVENITTEFVNTLN